MVLNNDSLKTQPNPCEKKLNLDCPKTTGTIILSWSCQLIFLMRAPHSVKSQPPGNWGAEKVIEFAFYRLLEYADTSAVH